MDHACAQTMCVQRTTYSLQQKPMFLIETTVQVMVCIGENLENRNRELLPYKSKDLKDLYGRITRYSFNEICRFINIKN